MSMNGKIKTEGKDFPILTKVLATFIFFSLNFLFLFSFFRVHFWILLISNFFIIYILISAIYTLKEQIEFLKEEKYKYKSLKP
jgi:hypothetical protein